MSKQKQNPNNSSVLQALLDLEYYVKSGNSDSPTEVYDAIQTIKNRVGKNDLKLATEKFDKRKYAFSRIEFSKLSVSCDIWDILESDASVKILLRIVRHMSQDNCYLVNRDILRHDYHMSKKTIGKALNELIEKGCIVKIGSLRSMSGTVYMVHPEIATQGKSLNVAIYENKVADDTILDEFEYYRDSSYTTLPSKTGVNGFSFNYETIVTDDEDTVNE